MACMVAPKRQQVSVYTIISRIAAGKGLAKCCNFARTALRERVSACTARTLWAQQAQLWYAAQ